MEKQSFDKPRGQTILNSSNSSSINPPINTATSPSSAPVTQTSTTIPTNSQATNVSNKVGAILNKPLSKGKTEVSLSAFSFLFSEFIQYSQVRVNNINELEKRLSDAGYSIGTRLAELIYYREKKWQKRN